jgi:SAM-dependent methyltransferase
MTNIWQDDDFAERYAVLNASGTNSYEHDVNEQSILSLIPSGVNSVLDYGCSSGHFTARLSDKYEVVGYDIAKSARDVAKSLYPKLTITGGAE